MKKAFVLAIIIIVIASLSFSLCSCGINNKSGSVSSEKTIGEISEISSDNQEVETSGDKYHEPHFTSVDDFMLAISDIDAFCSNGTKHPDYYLNLKENIRDFTQYKYFAYTDNYDTFYAELHNRGYLTVHYYFKNGVEYSFYYNDIEHAPESTEEIGELRIGDQIIKMFLRDPSLNSSYYKYVARGDWKFDGHIVHVYAKSNNLNDLKNLEDFLSVDLIEFASEYCSSDISTSVGSTNIETETIP